MSYTNREQVQHHLISSYPVADELTDQRLRLSGSDYVRFYGGGVDASTVSLKSIQQRTQVRTTVTLVGGSGSVAGMPLVPGSVVVAADSSLGTVYDENVDYVIDYATAALTIKSGGAITAAQQLVVWYLPFVVYAVTSDYLLDAARGRIKRVASGDIADGETVWIDYRPTYLSVADEIIDNAVAMANSTVEREVDPDRQFEVDPILAAAATYRALEIVCRAAASRELSSRSSGDKTATVWIKLADGYSEKSDLLLRSFRPPYEGPRSPIHG